MKLPYLPCNLKYLGVACKRSNSDVGMLIKGLLAYMTIGKTMRFENEGMQMLYDLFVDDICDFLALKLKQSATNSNNARSKNNAGVQKSRPLKKNESVATADKNPDIVEVSKPVTTADETNDCNGKENSTSLAEKPADVANQRTERYYSSPLYDPNRLA